MDLGSGFQFPTDVQRSSDPTTGYENFPDLPYYLRVRFFHDPVNHRLGFRGFNYSPHDGGSGALLVNIMSLRERGIIESLDASADPNFRKAVDSLYRVTRNPNGLDLTGDGSPDDSLLIGLTQQVTTNGSTITTNIVRENLGSNPKALTAGQPLPDSSTPRPYGVRFDGTAGSRMAIGQNYANVTNNFTIDFWVKPEHSQPDTPEETSGIVDRSEGDQFVVYPTQGGEAYGANHAGVGVAVGTDRISVFEHTDNVLCSLLVYPVALSGWHHVAVVYENSTPTLYLDGVQVRTGLISPRIVHPSADLASVDAAWGNYGAFAGTVTDLHIWNEVRQPADIVLSFGQKLTGNEPGLAGLWRLDEGAGAIAHDRSPAAHDGVLGGGYSWTEGTGVAGRYVVVAENNDPSLPGLPVGLHVIQIGNPLTRGNLVVIQPDNVLDERVTIRHSADFRRPTVQLYVPVVLSSGRWASGSYADACYDKRHHYQPWQMGSLPSHADGWHRSERYYFGLRPTLGPNYALRYFLCHAIWLRGEQWRNQLERLGRGSLRHRNSARHVRTWLDQTRAGWHQLVRAAQ